MADHSAIEWTEATWNPVVGCSILSPGCTNCYAMKMAARIEKMQPVTHYAGTTKSSKAGPVWTGRLALAPDHILIQPLRWKKPRTIFVNSMGDLFHEDVPDGWIDRVFAVMALSPQHTFQVLTKRSARMRKYLRPYDQRRADALGRLVLELGYSGPLEALPWPLPNVWLGVSAERQQEADERIPDLLATPAAIRFVSAEPLLGPINFRSIWKNTSECWDALDGSIWRAGAGSINSETWRGGVKLDWIIVGGESGNGARPMHPDWARSIRDQCSAGGVPFFFKQWGEHLGGEGEDSGDAIWFEAASHKRDSRWLKSSDEFDWFDPSQAPYGTIHLRTGKHNAGRLLDGVGHSGMPAPREVPFQ